MCKLLVLGELSSGLLDFLFIEGFFQFNFLVDGLEDRSGPINFVLKVVVLEGFVSKFLSKNIQIHWTFWSFIHIYYAYNWIQILK